MFQGSFVAIVTPFKNDEVDYASLERLIEFQIENGTSGLVPCGTTGESPTLSYEEHKAVVAFVVRQAAGRVPVIAGTGANSTKEAIELTRDAADSGADGCLQVSPYYNKPEPEGMFLHFKAIADAAHLPIILYNVPSRTGREIAMETVCRLADEVKEVVAIKDAGGSVDRVTETKLRTRLDILSGDDSMTLPMMSVGACGVISVVANIVPRAVAEMVSAALQNDFALAGEAHARLYPLFKAAFLESNPAPVKVAMEMMGLCSADVRLPLSSVRPATREAVSRALKGFGLLGKAE